jgi:hypothetical protein
MAPTGPARYPGAFMRTEKGRLSVGCRFLSWIRESSLSWTRESSPRICVLSVAPRGTVAGYRFAAADKRSQDGAGNGTGGFCVS